MNNALSFYRSQNVLGWSKFFVPDQKFIYIIVAVTNILCQTKRWFAFSKNWFLCRHKSFWRGTKCSQIFVLAQKIWTSTKHFGTCKRTRHYSSGPKCSFQRHHVLDMSFWQGVSSPFFMSKIVASSKRPVSAK